MLNVIIYLLCKNYTNNTVTHRMGAWTVLAQFWKFTSCICRVNVRRSERNKETGYFFIYDRFVILFSKRAKNES